MKNQIKNDIKRWFSYIFQKIGKDHLREFSRFTILEIIEENPDLPWVWDWVSENPNLTIQFVKENLYDSQGNKRNWSWNFISYNRGITMKDIEKNLDLPWDWYWISMNPNLTLQFVKENLHDPQGNERDWNWERISKNPGITMKDIQENLDLLWDWVSMNPNLTLQFVKDNLYDPQGNERKWNWAWISKNPGITMEDIQENPDFPWRWNRLSENPNLTIQFIKENSFDPQGNKREWSWIYIYKNPGLTMKDIRENLSLSWDWHRLSFNPNLTIQFVEENLYDPQGNKRNWNWYCIFSFKNIIKEQIRIYNRHISALKIQSWWRNIRVDERKKTGRRLVLHRFLEI